MSKLKLRHRHRFRRKEIASITQSLEETLGCKTFTENDAIEVADAGDHKLLILKGQAYGIYINDELFLSIRGLLEFKASKRHVTVDMGAVKFIANGADVMAPGIVDADPDIQEGQGVWIRDEKNNRPLAVGRALMDAGSMIKANDGKAIKTLHYVGDKIWSIGE